GEVAGAVFEIKAQFEFVAEVPARSAGPGGQRHGVAAPDLPGLAGEVEGRGQVGLGGDVGGEEGRGVTPRQRGDVADGVGAEPVDLAAEGPLVVDLVVEAPEVAVVDPGEPAVFAGELVAAVFVAGVDAQGEAVFDAQDEVGFAVGPTGGVDEEDGGVGVGVETGKGGPLEGGVGG